MKRFLEITKFFFGVPVSLIALIFIVKTILPHTSRILLQIKEMNILLLVPVIACFLLYFLLRVMLWREILGKKGHTFSIKETSFLWAMSELKRYIPGNIWSFFTRFILYSERNVQKHIVFSALIQEAKTVVLGSALVSVFALPFVFTTLFPYPVYATPALILSYGILTVTLGWYLHKNTKHHIYQLLLACLSFIFFGIGTYVSITAIAPLAGADAIMQISFTVFCYLIGYVSFITPMGIGVREGMLTLGFSHFMISSLAGFTALFARLLLIISELLFLGISLLWHKTNIELLIKKYRYEMGLGIGIAFYIAYFTMASFLRYDNFFTGRFDLGNMDQTVWNTFQGRIFQLTDPNGTEIISRLAFHADFILILLAPLYVLWADPRMLLFVQTVVLSLGALFVFLLAKKMLNNKLLALTLSLAFLLNPGIQYANLYDFHSVTLAATFLLGAFYFLHQQKHILFLVFAILAALTKENIWIIVGLFGLYIAVTNFKNLRRAKLVFGLCVFFVSMSTFYYLVWQAIPTTRGTQHFALSYYSDFGDSPTNIVKNIFLSPGKTITTLTQTDQLNYVVYLLTPFGFLPILTPMLLIFSGPDFLIVLLSNNAQLRQVYFHYSASVVPFLCISTIFSIAMLRKRFPAIPLQFYSVFLICTSLLAAYLHGPLPMARNQNITMFTQQQSNKTFIDAFLSKIHTRYSVAATNNLGSHLSRRQRIYTIPNGINKADVIVFLLNDPFAQPSLEAQKNMVQRLKENSQYKILVEKDDFIAFQKRELPNLLL